MCVYIVDPTFAHCIFEKGDDSRTLIMICGTIILSNDDHTIVK